MSLVSNLVFFSHLTDEGNHTNKRRSWESMACGLFQVPDVPCPAGS